VLDDETSDNMVCRDADAEGNSGIGFPISGIGLSIAGMGLSIVGIGLLTERPVGAGDCMDWPFG
jgi:hypothetical protein